MDQTPAPAAAPAPGRRCENCGAQLLGEHCFACGQPTKGLVRHFSSIVGDFFDSVFNFDTRTFRTLGPLLFRPGHLSQEYFHGHRVRYVSPVRLFFFLCIAAFFALKLTVDIDLQGGHESARGIARAQTAQEVERLRDEAVAGLRQARDSIPDAPGARAGMDAAIAGVQAQSQARLDWLARRDAARARGEELPSEEENAFRLDLDGDAAEGEARATPDQGEAPRNRPRVRASGPTFNGKPWDPVSNPVRIEALGDTVNGWINQLVGRAKANATRIEENPRLLVEAFIEALPQTLFVLLPLFALLLKVLYLFKRRLYMEHLIVALHSHAFLCAAILLLVGAGELRDLAGPGPVHGLLGWVEAAIAIWMPLYLLLMQKRVYGQGWILTLLKFGVLGLLYTVLLSLGAAANLLVSVGAL